MSRSPLRKFLIAVGLLGLTLLVLLVFSLWRIGLLPILFKQNPGPFDRPRFEAIVEQVRQAGLKPDTEQQFFLNDLSDPKSLHRLSDEEVSKIPIGKAAGRVWTQVSPHGALKVVIETRDFGHAGEYGFAYSDASLLPTPMDGEGNWYRLDVPGNLYIVVPNMKIDAHWWKVLNNLD